MAIRIALAGNPNSGKTTLFNALTGSNQFVGNWPGVTVEKKEGRLKGNKEINIMDLPGIYSLSPYTLEEVVARDYLIGERPDAILNIVDGTNLERNLYLTTQLAELGIPMVIAVNMMDIVQKSGDKIDMDKLSKEFGCKVVEISALKGTGITEAAAAAAEAANAKKAPAHQKFAEEVEAALEVLAAEVSADISEEQKRFYTVKLFERDRKVAERIKLTADAERAIEQAETSMDDDSESIITNERYIYIARMLKGIHQKQNQGGLTTSDKVDQIVTNRWLALPIFAIVMYIVYYVSVTTVGGWATDWANDGVFGDGWHLFGIGSAEAGEATEAYEIEMAKIDAFIEAATDEGIDTEAVEEALALSEDDFEDEEEFKVAAAEADEAIAAFMVEAAGIEAEYVYEDEDGEVVEEGIVDIADFDIALIAEEPDPADYGVWILGIPVLFENALDAMNVTSEVSRGVILDGVVAGVGAVLGFVPQILILFIFLAFLEGCGYMARIAFIMDRIFRKFGLSGKSFIPMLIGTGCGIPGVMASRTIENERDRRMTIMTTTFVPCGAKLPIIALIAGALFGGAPWVGPSAYFIGIGAIIVSGIILKKTKMFTGDPAPFVMELPAYHMPTVGNILRSMWERGWSFIKKAGTIVLLSTIVIWFLSSFGMVDGSVGMVEDLSEGFLAAVGSAIAWVFAPLGWGHWQAAVAAITGLVAKENVVGTFGILYGFAEVAEDGVEIWSLLAGDFTTVSAYGFLVFNLLCAPCFAAIGAIRREMNNAKWTTFAIVYQTVFAYLVSFAIYQLGTAFTGGGFGIGAILGFAVVAGFGYFLFKPESRAVKKTEKTDIDTTV